ncbi:dihydrofolate reductase family protein [Streptomyces sp. NPDC048213]|uniref:dihydrofolate reductase family protein n=1 Tax=unclassified Streptomyces TaxID=2593676 RepID=UPI0033E0B32F
MRKIIYWMSMSLDGFIEGPGRNIDWHTVDEELHSYFNEQLAGMGGMLDGRVTHQLMADFWPTADQDPANEGPMAEFAVIWRNMPKYVYSRTLEHADWNTTIVREVIPEEVRALKEQPGGDLALGGADLAASFAAHDLIDQYRVYIHPVLIGRGKPMFPAEETMRPLRLTGSRTFGTGVVELCYDRADR